MDYKDAAKRLGVSVGTVYNWLKSGKLKGEKKESGEWDISIESINEILGQFQYEADLVKFELTVDKHLKKQEEMHLKMINHFCKDFVELYESGNSNALSAAEKIVERVRQIEDLKKAKETINLATQSEFTGFELMDDEGGDE